MIRFVSMIMLGLLLVFLPVVQAELTEAEIIAKEIAWARHSLKHFQHGFSSNEKHHYLRRSLGTEHNNEQDDEELDLSMPEHIPIVINDEEDWAAVLFIRQSYLRAENIPP